MFEIPVSVDKHNTYSTVLMQVDSLSKLDTRNSILDPRFSKTSRIEARVEFRDVRGRSRIYRDRSRIYRVEFWDFRVGKTKDFSRD